MFEYRKITMISKTVTRTFDKDGKVVRKQTILSDGGLGQEEAEKKVSESENKMKRMDGIFAEMDKLMKDMFG